MWFQICDTMTYLSTKLFFRKKHKTVNNLWRILGTKLVVLLVFWDHIFKTVVPKSFFWLFSTWNWRFSRNMCQLLHKLCSSQNISPWCSNFEIIFFKAIKQTILDIFPQIWDQITKTVFSNFCLLISTLSSKMSRNMCILRYKLCNVKNWVALRLTWKNEP